jgi:hypothetical protein
LNIKNGKPVRNVLTGSLFVLVGAAAWIVLSAGQAGAFVSSDQDATTTNVGVGVANTGGNAAVGNASTNSATSDQTASATGGGGAGNDTVAVNDSNTSNNSNGSATIVTGHANAVGNDATNNTQQVAKADDAAGAPFVLADQDVTTTNIGVGVANTGLNVAAGNLSDNTSDVDQHATANGGGGDAVAVNTGTASNNSNGTATIITGNATAVGNQALNNAVQVVDADGASSFVLADQSVDTLNAGFGIANSGINFAFGNLSTNDNTPSQTATAVGGAGDQIAANTITATNNSAGNALIATGNATGIGSASVNNNSQVLNADGIASVHNRPNTAVPLLLLMFGLLFALTPLRRLGIRSR